MMRLNRSLSLSLAIALAVICAGAVLVFAISQEIPTGSFKGTVVAEESGSPLPASVRLSAAGRDYHRSMDASREGKFSFMRIPAGEYTLEISSAAHSMEPMQILIEEGQTSTIEAELSPAAPSLDLYIHQHIFTPDEKAQVTCKGFVDADALDVRIYRVDLNTFLLKSGGELRNLLGIDSYQYDSSGQLVTKSANLDTNSALKLENALQVPITTRDFEGVFTQRINLPTLGPGLYVTSVSAGGVRQIGWVMVTSLGMVTKTVGEQTLAYTVDLKTGAPVPASEVTVYVDQNAVASGKTNAEGIINLKLPQTKRGSGETIVAHSGDSFAFTSAYLSSSDESDKIIYAYTDRPVYKPGQRVYYKGILRQSQINGYTVPPMQPVTVEVRDSRDTLIYRATRRTDKYGSFSGSLPLNPETATGYYTLVSMVEGQERGESIDFQVAAYRKPEFSVNITFPKKQYVRGETVKARVTANYYFGAPLANAKVRYVVNRAPYWLFEGDEEEAEYEGYEDYGGYGEMAAEGEVRTDSNGMAEIEFPADWPQPEGRNALDNDQEFSVEAYVTDKGGEEASGTASVIATRGEYALQVEPDRYVVEPGESVNVSIQAMYYDKRPVKRQAITVVTGREIWSDESSESKFQLFQEQQVTTDDSGRASVKVSVKTAGDMQIIVKATDRRGNKISTMDYVWCYGGAIEEEWPVNYSDLQIVTDKKIYNPGDVAKVLINSKYPGTTALVTIEGSRIYDSMTVKLTGASTLVRIPVSGDYKPNFYIGVCMVRNKKFYTQQARARVSLNTQSIRVRIDPNKSKYLPGEKAVYKITATDSKGKPVRAQLSLGVVDEAIYAIERDRTTPVLDYFFARKPNRVDTNFSFPQIYLSDPDKAGSSFLKTPPGNTRIRKRFEDTAYWNPNIVTGADGTATVNFQLPDNLTTWRATVRGITSNTLCGEARKTVLAQQDFLVRLETPRFLVQSDNSTITAVVHNYTGVGQRVNVTLRCPGLKVDGRLNREISVGNNGTERIDWNVSAPNPGSYDVTVRASTGQTGDAMQIALPVYPHGMERVTQTVGSISGDSSAKMNVEVRRDSIPNVTRLKIRLAPSLASSMLGSLQFLAEYPYGCTEQTTSSFIPDVILSRSFKELGMRNPRLEAELPDMVTSGLFRLYRFQLDDGGWSWCEYGKSDPWMTAYVCYGLIRAREAGFEVNEDILERGQMRLNAQISGEAMDTNTRAFCLYVLALAGQDVRDSLARVAQARDLDSRTLAYIALGFNQIGNMDQAKVALSRLFQKSILERGIIHWETGRGYFYDGDGVETTALALQALLKIDPTDQRSYQIVRWLMQQRQGNAWYSTRDTAMVLYAMSEFFRISKELSPDSDVTVSVNGHTVAQRHFGKDSIFDPEFEVTVSDKILRKGRNALEIKKTGAGNIYYSSSLGQYLAKDFMPETVTGPKITVTRQYYSQPNRGSEDSSDQKLGSPINGCRVGDVILVRLVVNSHSDVRHILVEDYIPAGCEILDRGHVSEWEWGNWWVGQDVRDQKISFYVDDLPPGKHIIEYRMRAGFAGEYHALPSQVFAMYEPRIRASAEESEFDIR